MQERLRLIMIPELKTLMETIEERIVKAQGHYFDPKVFLEYFGRGKKLLADLNQMNPAIFSRLADIQTPSPVSGSDFEGRGYLTKDQFYPLVDVLKRALSLAEEAGSPTASLDAAGNTSKPVPPIAGAVDDVMRLCRRFHLVATQLTGRHSRRPTIEITDEYDVQDLMHALLRIFFDDVRPEEWSPSYAGGSKRMDFLIKDAHVAIEAKMTRKGLGAKKVGEQLIVDIANYKQHQNCNTLVCIVYDPDEHIRNPKGIERDLSKRHDALEVRVLVVPER